MQLNKNSFSLLIYTKNKINNNLRVKLNMKNFSNLKNNFIYNQPKKYNKIIIILIIQINNNKIMKNVI